MLDHAALDEQKISIGLSRDVIIRAGVFPLADGKIAADVRLSDLDFDQVQDEPGLCPQCCLD